MRDNRVNTSLNATLDILLYLDFYLRFSCLLTILGIKVITKLYIAY